MREYEVVYEYEIKGRRKEKNLGSVDGNDVVMFLCEVVRSSWSFGSVEC